LYEVAWPCKNTKVDVDFWGYLWTFPITIRWDVQHPSNNTCVEQWYYTVDYPVNNDCCNTEGALNHNHVDGNIHMIVYSRRAAFKFWGSIIDLPDGDGELKKLRNQMKPTARQTSISKSLTTSTGATLLWITKGWKGLELYKVVQPTSIGFFSGV